MNFTDDDLYRYAFGELDDERSAALETEILKNPGLKKRVEEATALVDYARNDAPQPLDDDEFERKFAQIDLEQKFDEIWKGVEKRNEAPAEDDDRKPTVKRAATRKAPKSSSPFLFVNVAALACVVLVGAYNLSRYSLQSAGTGADAPLPCADDFGSRGLTVDYSGSKGLSSSKGLPFSIDSSDDDALTSKVESAPTSRESDVDDDSTSDDESDEESNVGARGKGTLRYR